MDEGFLGFPSFSERKVSRGSASYCPSFRPGSRSYIPLLPECFAVSANRGAYGVFICLQTVRRPLSTEGTQKRTYSAFYNFQPRLIAQATKVFLVITAMYTIRDNEMTLDGPPCALSPLG
jgi:hypothetical protein